MHQYNIKRRMNFLIINFLNMYSLVVSALLLISIGLGANGEDCKLPKGMEGKHEPCCTYAPKFQEKLNESTEACIKLLDPTGPKDAPPKIKGFDCLPDCLMSTYGMMKDGKLDLESIKKIAASVYVDDWKEGGQKIVDVCLAEIEKEKPSEECKSKSDILLKCVMRQTILNCPKSFWNAREECTQLKTKLEKCPLLTIE